ncbi:hypothetical protein EVAR_46427_1 [Eumeta japonica]|uniref:Uncharacterized protein n=1 Tax=Eumeta variegata TaxID=151549 RepID=A0A4C1XCJ4_EUMVA|nr:hypothetical protein EVAR_46427_1 [Eumeta japonica]
MRHRCDSQEIATVCETDTQGHFLGRNSIESATSLLVRGSAISKDCPGVVLAGACTACPEHSATYFDDAKFGLLRSTRRPPQPIPAPPRRRKTQPRIKWPPPTALRP